MDPQSDTSIFLHKIWKMIPQNKGMWGSLPEDNPAYRFLKAAGLAVCDKQIVKTTIRELS